MRIADLFAGCGGMSLGFSDAGHKVVKAYDSWLEAVNCYRDNFPHEIAQADLTDVKQVVSDLKNLDVNAIIGGPPCQDFSQAGKRTEGPRASLTYSFAMIVEGVRPNWYVMENVERTMKSQAYEKAREALKNAGYGITEVILDASYCGVPQKRKRFFSIGRLEEADGFLLARIDAHKSKTPTTLRDYFGEELGLEYYYRHPRNYNRRGIFSIDEPAPTIRGVNRPVPAGYKGHPNDPVPISDKIRALSMQERAMVQTFPKDFKFNTTKTNVEQLIGNAVPVKLSKFIGLRILEHEEGVPLPPQKSDQQLCLSFTAASPS